MDEIWKTVIHYHLVGNDMLLYFSQDRIVVFFFSFCHVNNRQLLPPSDIISLHSIYIYIPLNDAVMFLQTDVSFSPYAGSVGRSLRDAEEELGALRRQRPV